MVTGSKGLGREGNLGVRLGTRNCIVSQIFFLEAMARKSDLKEAFALRWP